MLYALLLTIAAGLVALFLLSGGLLFARHAVEAARRGEAPFGRWRFYPSPLGLLLLLLLPLAALVLWRVFPAFFFLPIIIPFFWRWRGRGGSILRRPRRGPDERDEDASEGRFRSPYDR